MLPKFRVILGGVVLTLLALMASGWGLVPIQESYTRIGDIPQVGRHLVQQAIMVSPEQHQFATAVAARRMDELQRLRDLPLLAVAASPADTSPEPDRIARLIEQVVETPVPPREDRPVAGVSTPVSVTPEQPSAVAAEPLADRPAEPSPPTVTVAALSSAKETAVTPRANETVSDDIGEPARPILNVPLPRANPRLASLSRRSSEAPATDATDPPGLAPAETASLPASPERADPGDDPGEPAQPLLRVPVPRANPRVTVLAPQDSTTTAEIEITAKPRPIRRPRPVRRPTVPPATTTSFFPDNNGTWAFGQPPANPR